MLDQSAMAVAADALGYPGASEVIERDRLSVIQAYRMFLLGAGQDRGRVAAVVVLTAATARRHFAPDDWNGEAEKLLAVAALDLTSDRVFSITLPKRRGGSSKPILARFHSASNAQAAIIAGASGSRLKVWLLTTTRGAVLGIKCSRLEHLKMARAFRPSRANVEALK